MIGKNILHYKILEKLGEGGMGIVWKAEDTKLNRQVAIKVLPPHLLISPDDKARFHREAKAAAALNHFNIATVYEINESEEKPFIVMEYVEGETLDKTVGAESLLPIQDAIDITIQIADGLAAAHKKGVVHRDIKASNILYSEEKKAKILDFGLAKTSMSTKLTQMGTTIGTVAYMSPEQVQGKEVDHRTDLWSLGVLIYEMIAGHLPFKADYDQAIFYSIQNENPDPLTAIRTGVPMSLEWIVNKLMAKDPAERYQSATDLIIDLKAVDLNDSGFSRISQVSQISTSKKDLNASKHTSDEKGSLFTWQTLVFLIVGVVLGYTIFSVFNSGIHQADLPVRNLSIVLPEEAPLLPVGVAPLGVGQPALALSPDGEKVVYVGNVNGTPYLFERPLDENDIRKLPGTEGAYMPCFSPDGLWVSFFANDRLKKIDLQSKGIPVTLCDAPDGRGATWAANDSIYVVLNQGSSVYKVFAEGGALTKVPRKSNAGVSYPDMLPDNQSLLLSIGQGVGTLDLKTGETTVLVKNGNTPRYLGENIIAFGHRGQLFAARIELGPISLIGKPLPVINNVRTEALHGSAQATFASDGTLAYVEGQPADKGVFVWVDRQGKEIQLDFPADYYGTFRLSPNGKELAVSRFEDYGSNIWIYNLEQGSQSQFTNDGRAYDPVWNKEGDKLIFSRQAADGSGSELMIKGRNMSDAQSFGKNKNMRSYDVSADGNLLSVYYKSSSNELNIAVLDMSGEDSLATITDLPSQQWGASFSPDGRYLAYTSDQTGRSEVFVTTYPASGQRWQVTFEGGEEPQWAPDGKELYFSKGRSWFRVGVHLKPGFSSAKPEVMFEGPYLNVGGLGYNISRDGRRFLLLRGSDMRTTDHIKIIQGWRDVLDKVLPEK